MRNPLIILLCFILSCNADESDRRSSESGNKINKAKRVIIIQPFEKLSGSTSEGIAKKLRRVYCGTVKINSPIQLPSKAYSPERGRYRADVLIQYLESLAKPNQRMMGLTDKDICITKNKTPDYGIIGLAYRPGNACIASSSRLKGKNKEEKFFKVVLHELGHSNGLNHCPDKSCIMRDAEGKDHFNDLSSFCTTCTSKLENSGFLIRKGRISIDFTE